MLLFRKDPLTCFILVKPVLCLWLDSRTSTKSLISQRLGFTTLSWGIPEALLMRLAKKEIKVALKNIFSQISMWWEVIHWNVFACDCCNGW